MYESNTDICFLLICCKEKVQWQRKSWKTEITERRGRKEAERGRYYVLHLQGKWWYKSFILIRQKVIHLTVWALLSMYCTNTSYSSLFSSVGQILCYLLLLPTSHFPITATLFPLVIFTVIRNLGVRVAGRIRFSSSLTTTFWNTLSELEVQCSMVFFSQAYISVGKRNSLKRTFSREDTQVHQLLGGGWCLLSLCCPCGSKEKLNPWSGVTVGDWQPMRHA